VSGTATLKCLYRRPLEMCIFCLLCVACAQQVPPSGGPEDRSPPKIVSVVPENKSTLVARDQVVEFEFTDRIDRKSVARALFITPNLDEDEFDVKLKGRNLRIEFDDSLMTDRTYVVTLGTDLKDERGNALSSSYTLAFSTGADISDAEIAGRVYDEQKKGVLIWAYILSDSTDPDPEKNAGDYATQTDNNGVFKLTNLSEGVYRVFAVKDVDNNRFFERGYDGLGVATRDVVLQDSLLSETGVNFRISITDTIGPALTSVSARDSKHIVILFDELIDSTGVSDVSNYTILTSDGNTQLAVEHAYLDALSNTTINLVTATLQNQDYELTVESLRDPAGNFLDLNYNSDVFVGSALPDTFRPEIVATTPEDSAKTFFRDKPLMLNFSEAMQRATLESNFVLRDSAGAAVKGQFVWPNPAAINYIPEKSLLNAAFYAVEIKLDSVLDLAGNAIASDSTLYMSFRTINADTFSTISGFFSDIDTLATGAVYLTATQPGKDDGKYQQVLEKPGPFEFRQLFPGVYQISGFRDQDNNGVYSFGSVVPFISAERFIVYDDSIKVRARWPNEGNDIILGK